MNVVDIAIVLLVVLSAVFGFRSGLIQSVASLIGLIAGIVIASWNYAQLAVKLDSVLHSPIADEAIAFCLIAIGVMIVTGLIGMLLRKVIHGVGLGWLDRFLGLLFGVLRGVVLAGLCVLVMVAFYPQTLWLGEAQLPHYFTGSLDVTAQVTPQEFRKRVTDGLRRLEDESAKWLKQK